MRIVLSLIIGTTFILNTELHYISGKVPILVRVPKAPKPSFINFNDATLNQVLLQVAWSYEIGYIKYCRGVDPRKKGVLGWGHASCDVPIREFCQSISTRRLCIYPKGDTLMVQKSVTRRPRK